MNKEINPTILYLIGTTMLVLSGISLGLMTGYNQCYGLGWNTIILYLSINYFAGSIIGNYLIARAIKIWMKKQ